MFGVVLAAALAFTQGDARFAYDLAGGLVSKYAQRDSGTLRSRFASGYLRSSIARVGARPVMDRFKAVTPRGELTFANIEAEWRVCPTGSWVVVISHYDTKPGVKCPGANDGASTTGLLVALARRFSETPPPGNVALMWLDGEECMRAYTKNDGFWGSRRAAKRLAESGRSVKAVICVDMLGDRDLEISIPKNTTPYLRAIAHLASASPDVGCSVMDMAELVKDDHMAFLQKGFPAIDLIDFEFGSAPGRNDYWHTPEDTMDKISEESLLNAGRLVCEMIDILHAR